MSCHSTYSVSSNGIYGITTILASRIWVAVTALSTWFAIFRVVNASTKPHVGLVTALKEAPKIAFRNLRRLNIPSSLILNIVLIKT
jgi:hypothetical protein